MKKLIPALLFAALVAIIVGVPLYATAAQLPCSITVDAAGNVSGFCAGAPSVPAPTPAPTPAPQPAPPPVTPPPPSAPGACPATPSNVVMQSIFIGGTNNYVFDDPYWRNPSHTPVVTAPQGVIQVFPLPKTWPDATPVTHAKAAFVSFIIYSQSGAQYEVAFSRCPGDFAYYKTQEASVQEFGQTFYPCGKVGGADMAVNWGLTGDLWTCQIDAGQWYMNWRVANCPANTGVTCGHVFGVPKG